MGLTSSHYRMIVGEFYKKIMQEIFVDDGLAIQTSVAGFLQYYATFLMSYPPHIEN